MKNEKWNIKSKMKNEKRNKHFQKWKNEKFKNILRGKYKDSKMKNSKSPKINNWINSIGMQTPGNGRVPHLS